MFLGEILYEPGLLLLPIHTKELKQITKYLFLWLVIFCQDVCLVAHTLSELHIYRPPFLLLWNSFLQFSDRLDPRLQSSVRHWINSTHTFYPMQFSILRVHWRSKEIKPVNPKGNQSWIFIGRTDAEAETPILWPPDAKNWLIWKDPDAGKDWRQEEKGMTEDEMVRWHHWLDGHEFEQALGVGDGQGCLVCCSSWGHKKLGTTERLNWTAFS